jgi:hypothetical protein
MAEKYSLIFKYKYLEYIDSADISDNDALIFIKGIVQYDKVVVILILNLILNQIQKI